MTPERVAVFAGAFASQPLTFAHLLDVSTLDFDHVEVICRADPGPRLRHVLSEDDARKVEDALGLSSTCVLVFDVAGPFAGSDLLRPIGTYSSQGPLAG